MKKLHGVKAKELLIWITLNEIYIDDPNSGKITFGTPTGISRSYPVSAFEVEEDKKWKEFSSMAKLGISPLLKMSTHFLKLILMEI